MKEIIAPISTENIIENPIVIPSNFTKNKSNSINFGLRFAKVKNNVMRIINKMK